MANALPANTAIYFEKIVDKKTGIESSRPILLENKVLMTGDMVKNAQVRIGGTFNEPYVSIDLTSRGGKVFGALTEKYVGRRMAIVLDGIVKSAPVIREKILGGSAQISGSFTHEEASDLAIVLRVGALPAPVDVIQNVTVGSTLGQDSIKKRTDLRYFRSPDGCRLHDHLLPVVRHNRQFRTYSQYSFSLFRTGYSQRHPDDAGYCRHRALYWYGS